METLLQVVFPAVVIFTTLFGFLSRGFPRPSGVEMFWRVGLTGLALGGVLWYVTYRTGLLDTAPEFVRDLYLGLSVGGGGLTVFAAIGSALKKQR
ncbi:MAG: hypothetical protein EXR72_10825 [Myxococcales bacterium]|nr:hypothetical protein [Myxococcales bacterium]